MGCMDFHTGKTGLFAQASGARKTLDNLGNHLGGHGLGPAEVFG